MEEKTIKNNKKSEEITVVLSPLEETLVKIPLLGEACSKILQKKYEKFFPEHEKVILY